MKNVLSIAAALFALLIFAPATRAQSPAATALVQVAGDTAKQSLQAKRMVAGKPRYIRLATASAIFPGDVLFVPPDSRPLIAFYRSGTRYRLAARSVLRVQKNDRLERVRGANPQPLAAYNPQSLAAFRFAVPGVRFGITKGGDLQRGTFRLLPVGAIASPNEKIAVSWAGERTATAFPLRVFLSHRKGDVKGETIWSGLVSAAQSPPLVFTAPELLPGAVYDCVCESADAAQATGSLRVLSKRDAKAVGANAAFLRRYIEAARDNDERGGTYCLLALLYEKHELYADADAAYEKARTLLPEDRLLKMAPRQSAVK